MTQNTVTSVQAGIVVVAAIAAMVLVPDETLGPAALVLLACGVAGVFAARAWLQRLHVTKVSLESGRGSYRQDVLQRELARLEKRMSVITAVGMAFGLIAVCSGMVAAALYSD